MVRFGVSIAPNAHVLDGAAVSVVGNTSRSTSAMTLASFPELAPEPNCGLVVGSREERAECDALAEVAAVIVVARLEPRLVHRVGLGEQDDQAAGVPVLQRRQRNILHGCAKPAQHPDRGLRRRADLGTDRDILLVKVANDADAQALEVACQRSPIVWN